MTVAVVTDSTAYLPAELIAQARLTVVPLHVIVDDHEYTEGVDLTPQALAAALTKSARVSTSRPAPTVFLEAYERLAAAGAEAIVSVHLSAGLSGTYDAAVLAARESPVPVLVVDSQMMGMALGFAVLAAARAAAAGAAASEVARSAAAHADASSVYFYVHTLDYLRRGGRIGAGSAFLGSALAIKPILALAHGHIEPVEKQRTTARAVARLVDLAEQAGWARPGPVDLAVHHLGAPERADKVAAELASRLAGRLAAGSPMIVELGAVAGAHLGPGSVAVAVSPRVP